MTLPTSIEKIINEYYTSINAFHSEYFKNENYNYTNKFAAYKKIFESNEEILDYFSQKISEDAKKNIKQYKKLLNLFDEFRKEYSKFCKEKKKVEIIYHNNKEYNLEEYFYDLDKIALEMLKDSNVEDVGKTLNEFLKKRIDYIAKGYQLSIMYLNLMDECSKVYEDGGLYDSR